MKLVLVILYLAAVLVAGNREDATFFEFDDNLTQTTNSTTAASSVPVPADLPTDLSPVHKAAAGLPSTALVANFKSLQEVGSGHYPADFPGGKARLTKDTKKLEFFAVFVNGEIVLVLDNFIVNDFGASDAGNELRFRIGNEEVLFKFFKVDDNIYTKITIGGRVAVSSHTTLESGGKLRIHLVKNVGIKIDGQEKDKDLSLSSTMPIVQTANGKEALKLTVDSSGMLKAAFDLSLETPFADDGSNTLAANLKYYLGGAAAFVGLVIIILLVVCIFKKSCWLHKKMFQQQTVPMPGDVPKEQVLLMESKMNKRAKAKAAAPKRVEPKACMESKTMSPAPPLKQPDKKATEWQPSEINRRNRSRTRRGKSGSTLKGSACRPDTPTDKTKSPRVKSTSYRAKMQDLDEYEQQVLERMSKKKAGGEFKESAVSSQKPGKPSEENANQSVFGAAQSRKSVKGSADQVNGSVNPSGGIAAAKGKAGKQGGDEAGQSSEDESPDVIGVSEMISKPEKPAVKKPEPKKIPGHGGVRGVAQKKNLDPEEEGVSARSKKSALDRKRKEYELNH